jgi:hypothetical protein
VLRFVVVVSLLVDHPSVFVDGYEPSELRVAVVVALLQHSRCIPDGLVAAEDMLYLC